MLFLSLFFHQIYCVILSYIQLTFPQTSECFPSNDTKNMHILASGAELQAVVIRLKILGYVIDIELIKQPTKLCLICSIDT